MEFYLSTIGQLDCLPSLSRSPFIFLVRLLGRGGADFELVALRDHAVDSQKEENWRADGLGPACPHLVYRHTFESSTDLERQRGIT